MPTCSLQVTIKTNLLAELTHLLVLRTGMMDALRVTIGIFVPGAIDDTSS